MKEGKSGINEFAERLKANKFELDDQNEDIFYAVEVEDIDNLEKEFDAVEVCPHCGLENIYPNWDIQTAGYVAVCNHCGKKIMLCDECFHADDNTAQNCDWCATVNGGKCFRGVTDNCN